MSGVIATVVAVGASVSTTVASSTTTTTTWFGITAMLTTHSPRVTIWADTVFVVAAPHVTTCSIKHGSALTFLLLNLEEPYHQPYHLCHHVRVHDHLHLPLASVELVLELRHLHCAFRGGQLACLRP